MIRTNRLPSPRLCRDARTLRFGGRAGRSANSCQNHEGNQFMTNAIRAASQLKRPLIRRRKRSPFLALLAAATLVGPASAQGVLTGAGDGLRSPDAAFRVVEEFDEAISTARCSPFNACYIELEPGETLREGSSWDEYRYWHERTTHWLVRSMAYGGKPERIVVEARPMAAGTDTTLAIPTDRRLYVIALVNDPDADTSVLRFRWPDSEAQ